MTTRSAFLFGLNDFAGGSEDAIYTAPEENVVLIKTIVVYNSNGLANLETVSLCTLFHHTAGGPAYPLIGFYENNVVPAPFSPGWWVLEPGDSLDLFTDGALLYSLTLYGALLEAP